MSAGADARPAVSAIDDATTPEGQLGLAFKRAMVAVRKLRGRETHRPGQLSFAQYGLLHGMTCETPRSARELAELADLSPATVTQMLESLENAGLVTRSRSLEDRRVVLSEVTEKGTEVLAQRRARQEPRWRAALSEFDAGELTTAARVLHRLADYFDDMLADPPQD